MPDDPPISTTVTETTTIDTGVDKESIETFKPLFEDFWKEQDADGEAAPSAPGAGQETKKSEPPPAKEQFEPAAKADEDIDKWELPSDLEDKQPQLSKQFKDIKALWHADRAKARAEAERATKLEQELTQARQNSWTPEQKADYEHAAAIRRKFDFASDPDFIAQYHTPIKSTYEQILEEAVQVLPDKERARAWADHMKTNYSPDMLNREWWTNSVLAKVPNELDRDALRSSITELNKLQKARDSEVQKRSNDQSSFNNWLQEKTETTAKRVQEEIMAEIGVQEKRIQEVLPKDASQAKTKEEKQAIEEHNERFTKLNTYFQKTMRDLSANGPKAWVRASVEATRAQLLEGEYKNMEKELKEAKTERDQLKAELDKIAGARRRISHTSGTPPAASSGKSNGQGLSIKDLDVRRSFEKFDWGDGS